MDFCGESGGEEEVEGGLEGAISVCGEVCGGGCGGRCRGVDLETGALGEGAFVYVVSSGFVGWLSLLSLFSV